LKSGNLSEEMGGKGHGEKRAACSRERLNQTHHRRDRKEREEKRESGKKKVFARKIKKKYTTTSAGRTDSQNELKKEEIARFTIHKTSERELTV